MKKILTTLISTLLFSFSALTFASVGTMEALKDDINGQFLTANQQIENALGILAERLNTSADSLIAYEKIYCNTKYDNCEGSDAATLSISDQNEIKDVIIHKVVGGWVSHGVAHSTNMSGEPDFDYVDIATGKVVFDKHLCLEVHFKTTSELKFAKPLYMNKTVVFCALEAGGSGLVDIDAVDNNTANGGNSSHLYVSDGTAGWRCFNPDDDLGNGGTAFGYDSDGTRVIDEIKGILNNCLKQKSVDLSI